MKKTKIKYIIARRGYSSCKNRSEHTFQHIDNKKKKAEIRRQYPRLTSPLWQCLYCDKVIESM